jgi:uncharacterized protein (TIGR01777 family)
VRIAITGSSGLIGRALRQHLTFEVDDCEVVSIVRREPGPGEVRWDPMAGRLDPADLEGLDAVVNLAGAGIGDHRWTDGHRRDVMESRRLGTTLLSEALAATKDRPAVLISGSAVGYYGDRGDEVLTERSAPGTGFLTEVCLAWEAATAPAEAAGIRVAHIRTGLVLDAKDGVLPRMALPVKLGAGGRLGSGKQWHSWITLDDEVRAIEFLMGNDVSGPVDLTAPDPATNASFTKALGRVLHRPVWLPVPKLPLQLALGRGRADNLLFTGQRVLPERLLEAGFRFRHPELEPALRSVLD